MPYEYMATRGSALVYYGELHLTTEEESWPNVKIKLNWRRRKISNKHRTVQLILITETQSDN